MVKKKSENFENCFLNNKKSQLKIQQMAFMLMAVTLFFVLAGIFVLVFKFSDLKNSATEIEEENAMLLVTKIANSPEFSCESAFSESRTNCVDADKVMILKENIAKYSNFWGVSNIEIRKIYPKQNKETFCNIGNYPNCNTIRLIKQEVSGFDSSNFVSLCRKESTNDETHDKCELAKMIVSYNAK